MTARNAFEAADETPLYDLRQSVPRCRRRSPPGFQMLPLRDEKRHFVRESTVVNYRTIVAKQCDGRDQRPTRRIVAV